jgi:hypothetical protein
MTTVTISTSVTYDTDTTGGGNFGNYGNNARPQHPVDDSQDIGGQGNGSTGNGSVDAVLNNMNIPDGIKDLLRMVLAGSSGESLPSEASAVDTMQKFQNEHKDKLGLISLDQLQDVASGKTDKINGVKVPDDVKEAAKAYVANNGALFDKVENAVTGKRDSQLSAADAGAVDRSLLSKQPTMAGTGPDSFMRACANGHISPNEPDEYDAVKTMGKFQKDNDIKLISYDQMKDIASGKTTEMNGKAIPEDVKDAASAYVANHGALFDKVESATDGKHDSQLSAGDSEQAVKKGLVDVGPMSEKSAVSTIRDFQKNGGPELINIDQMQDIASGKITKLGGKEITPDVKAAAQAYVADNGALFDKMEAALKGEHDSKLSAADADAAPGKGIYLSDRVPGSANQINIRPDDTVHINIDISGGNGNGRQNISFDLGGQPAGSGQRPGGGQDAASDARAVEAMEKFQSNGGPKLVSFDQMKGIADGSITSLGGKDVTPEVKAAAQAYVANNGALFDKVESATTNKHDSQLSAGDAGQARSKDIVGMSDSKAVDTIADLQKDGMKMLKLGMMPGSLISFDQLKEVAEKGTMNGKPVSDDVKQAAQAYVANDGALFDKVEAAVTGKHDSLLSGADADQAHKQDIVTA